MTAEVDPEGRANARTYLAMLWPRPRGAAVPRWLLAVVFLTACAVQTVRTWPLRNSIWAEDGTIFLAAAVDDPLSQTLLTPYAGYLHVLPRILAEVVSWLPLAASAAALLAGAVLVVVLLALVLLVSLGDHVPSLLGRAVVVGFVVLLPVGRETVGNIANLHWLLLATAVCVMFWTPRGRPGTAVAVTVVVLAALSNPFGPGLLAIAGVRAWALRDRTAVLLLVALLVASSVQVAAVLSAERAGEGTPSPVRLAGGYVAYVVSQAAAGEALAGGGVRALAIGAVGLLLLGGVAAVGVLGTRPRVPLALAVVLGAASGVTWCLFFGLSGVATPRYVVVPAVLLVVAVAAVLTAPGGWVASGGRRRPAVVLAVVLVAAGWAVSWPLPDRPGQEWQVSLDDATNRCGRPGADQAEVPISPDGWEVALDCDDLTQRSSAKGPVD